MRKTIKHKVYSIEEKNQIVKRYLDGEIRFMDCIKEYDLGGRSILRRWRNQYLEYGTTIDNRGRKKFGGKTRGRPKKVNLSSLSKAELISIIRVYEDIKKAVAYLRRQRKSIKSSMN